MILWVGNLCWDQVGHVSLVCSWSVRQSASGCCRVTRRDGGVLAMCRRISSSRGLARAFHVAGWSSKKTCKNMQGFLMPELGTGMMALLPLNWPKQILRSDSKIKK